MEQPQGRAARTRVNDGRAAAEDSGLDLRRLLRALQAVRDGDFSVRLAGDQTGLAGKIADTFNEIVTANERLARELERAKAEHALRDADHSKNEFLAILAHELRNPLAPILNAVQLLRMKLTTEQRRWSQEVIERQVTHLARLVDDLLDVSRITRGTITLARAPIAVATVLARALETTQPLIQGRGQTLTVQLPEEPLIVHGDLLRLTQALGNVLGNAAKYTDRGGRITVAVEADAAEVRIRVRDNGVGILPERLPHIFDLLTHDHRGDHPDCGLGIGLALVRRLIEMHAGSVSASSEGTGRGSEFLIRLPLHTGAAPEMPAAGETLAAAAPAAAGAAARRILVADDNADAVASLSELLRLCGHEVFSAGDGRAALEAAERHRPDVVLLDIGMPLLDGYEVARGIRAQPWGREMLLLALTGWGQDADRHRSAAAGFDLHMVKPLDIGKLTQLLSQQAAAGVHRGEATPVE